jgi:hypothetical protein
MRLNTARREKLRELALRRAEARRRQRRRLAPPDAVS